MNTLYDAPGPRTRAVTAVLSLIVLVLVGAAGYVFVYRPLDERGQFSSELWGPLVDPGNEYFPQVWDRLGAGIQATLLAAAAAIVSSLVVGTALAILRVRLRMLARRRFVGLATPVAFALRVLIRLVTVVTRLCVEVFRGIPVVITIFFVWVALPTFGVSFEDAMWYLVIGLTVYNSVVIGEILRSGMDGLPGGQREAAEAIGLLPGQVTWLVLLPQAFRIMLPALISQLVVVLKDTSLGFIISYEETMRVSSQIVQVLENPIQVYALVGCLYIMVNYALSKLAQYVQHRLAVGRQTAPVAAGPIPMEQGALTAAGTPVG